LALYGRDPFELGLPEVVLNAFYTSADLKQTIIDSGEQIILQPRRLERSKHPRRA
jgi:hypothetical protein